MPSNDDLELHAQAFQVQFDDLVVTARTQKELFLHSPGSIVVRERDGRGYWYWRFYALTGKEQEQSLGPVGDEQATARKADLEARIAFAQQLAKDASSLRRHGYCSADNSAAIAARNGGHATDRSG